MAYEILLEQVKNAIELPASSSVGSFILYILNRNNGRTPFSLFKTLNYDISSNATSKIIFFDMVISSILGGTMVCLLTVPQTAQQAVIAGLGMTGILSAYAKDTEISQ